MKTNFLCAIWKKMCFNSQEAEDYFTILGFIIVFSFSVFYFLNLFVFDPFAHENTYLRVAIIFSGFVFIFHKKWPALLKKMTPVIFYAVLFISFPFFFTLMLFENPDSEIWHINGLVGFLLLSFFVDWVSFIVVAFMGVAAAFFLATKPIDFQLISILGSYSAPIIYSIIFTRKKQIINQQLEQKVEERTKELKKALAAKTEFLNNLSHEISTPIQGFTVLSEGLVENWHSFEDKKKFDLASTVANNAKRLASLMLSLLDLSKFNANKVALDIHEIDLVEVTQDIIKESEDLYIRNKNIEIETHFPDAAILGADYNKIGQVLRNLFSNAVKFSPNNGKLRVAIEALGNQWRFSISDQGMGIPDNELEEIFDHFVQSTRTKTGAGGTGLGLSICRKIIEAHNGVIWAENNLNSQGATFYFIIPRLNIKN